MKGAESISLRLMTIKAPKERKKKSFQTCGVDQSKLCLISCRPTLLKALLDWYLSFGL